MAGIKERIIKEVDKLPEDKIAEVYDIIYLFRIGIESQRKVVKDKRHEALRLFGIWRNLSSKEKGEEHLKEKVLINIDAIAISIISYYEIVSGLQSINANKRIDEFDKFCKLVEIVNLDKSSILSSCKIYAFLKKSGNDEKYYS